MGLGSDAVLRSNPNSFISLHPFSLQAKCPLLSKGPADSSQCNSRETHGGHMAGVERRRRSDYHTPSIHTQGQADIREDVKIPTWGLFGKSGTQPSSRVYQPSKFPAHQQAVALPHTGASGVYSLRLCMFNKSQNKDPAQSCKSQRVTLRS